VMDVFGWVVVFWLVIFITSVGFIIYKLHRLTKRGGPFD